MSTGKLYQEAIDEAKGLVQMAEENAKNKLIEAFTPHVRKLIEKSLLGEAEDDMDIVMSAADDDDEESEKILTDIEDSSEDMDLEVSDEVSDDFDTEDFEFDDDTDEVDADGITLQVPKGVKRVSFDLSESERSGEKTGTQKNLKLNNESVKTLLRLVDGEGSLVDRTKALRMELKIVGRALNALNESGTKSSAALRIVEEFNAVLRKAIGLKQEIKDTIPGPLAEASRKEFDKLTEEIEQMSTRSLLRNLLAEKKNRKLFEAEGDEEEADAAETEMEVDVDAVKSAVEALAGAVGMEVSASEEEGSEDEGGDEAADDEELDLEMDEMEMDETMYEMADEMDEADEADEMEKKHESFRRGQVVYSIDESMLRRELRRLRSLRESAEDMAGHYGGGDKDGDLFEDPPELNALAEKDEPKKARKQAAEAKKEAEEAKKEADDAKKEAVKEARINRALKARLAEAAKAVSTLNRQLAEQKLFNAKLLYVNKLMQNRGLSDKQLRSVVEALDAATTIREAKLLYTSLSESLTRSAGSVNEGSTRTAGGSSRPTRSSSTLNESVGETDRWAILAGIKN